MASVKPSDKLLLWHRRLGHRSIRYLEKNVNWLQGTGLTSQDFIKGKLQEEDHCDACMRTKSTKQARVKEAKERNHEGEIATDLYGPFPEPTRQGSYYIQGIIRIGSRWADLYGLKRKSEVTDSLKKHLSKWPSPRTKHYHADGARELISQEIQKILEDTKPPVGFSFTSPYSPNQNSYSERLWRTLIDMAHPSMLLSELPFFLVEDALKYANWIRHRLPTQTDKGWMSPHEYEYPQLIPDLAKAKRWGCKAYVHIPEERRTKGSIENAQSGYFVGFDDNQPYGYNIYIPKLNNIINSSNVTFIETIPETVVEKARRRSGGHLTELDFYLRNEAQESSSIEDFLYLVGKRYYDRDDREIYETTSVTKRGNFIVANRKKVKYGKVIGKETDNNPIFVRDVEEMLNDETYSDLIALATSQDATHQSKPLQSPAHMRMCSDCVPGPYQSQGSLVSRKERSSKPTLARDWRCKVADIMEISKRAQIVREPEPDCIQEALRSQNPYKWFISIADEINCIENEKQVWYKESPPKGKQPLGTRFVFKQKEKDDIDDDVFRARLVVQGYNQVHGIDFEETFSPTVKAHTFRLFLYFILLFDMTLPVHLDAIKAYMNSDIDADIWVFPPKDPDEIFFKKGTTYRLKKALYGLKQSGRLWYDLARKLLIDLGFKSATTEPCFFYCLREGVLCIIILYVDDLLISSQSKEIREWLVKTLMKTFEFTNNGVVSEYLGVRIMFVINDFQRFITLDQTKNISKVISTYGLQDVKSVSVPINPTVKLSHDDESVIEGFPYRQLVGSALHISRWTRCDISFGVGLLSRFNSRPTAKAAKCLLDLWVYLRDTSDFKLVISLSTIDEYNFKLTGYSDSDWAGDLSTRRSTTGWMTFLGQSLINWVSELQSFIAQSSMEAETIAANKLLNEILYLQNLFNDTHLLKQEGTPMLIDNQSAIQSAQNPTHHKRTKHFEITEFHLRENTEKGRVVPTKVPSACNTSDLLTKALDRDTLHRHRTAAGVHKFFPHKSTSSDHEWR